MRVLLVNGSPRAAGCTFTALSEVASTREAAGVATEIIQASFDREAIRAAAEKALSSDGS